MQCAAGFPQGIFSLSRHSSCPLIIISFLRPDAEELLRSNMVPSPNSTKKKSSISALRPLNHYVCGESAYILAQLSNMGLFSTVAFCLSWVSPLIVVYIVSPIPAIVPRSLFRVGIELSLGRTVGFRDRFTDVPYSCHFIMTSLYFFSALGIFCTELSRALRN